MTRVYYSIALTFTGTPVHFLFIHFFFNFPGPPNFFMSLQEMHVPQLSLKHPLHCSHFRLSKLLKELSVKIILHSYLI